MSGYTSDPNGTIDVASGTNVISTGMTLINAVQIGTDGVSEYGPWGLDWDNLGTSGTLVVSSGATLVVAGTVAAQSGLIEINGSTASVAIGDLSIGVMSPSPFINGPGGSTIHFEDSDPVYGDVLVDNGGSLGVSGTVAIGNGGITVDGIGSSLTFGGDSVFEAVGGTITLDEGGSAIVSNAVSNVFPNIVLDAASSLTFGTVSSEAIGAVVIGTGYSLAFNSGGTISAPNVIDHGLIITGQAGLGGTDITGRLSGDGTIFPEGQLKIGQPLTGGVTFDLLSFSFASGLYSSLIEVGTSLLSTSPNQSGTIVVSGSTVAAWGYETYNGGTIVLDGIAPTSWTYEAAGSDVGNLIVSDSTLSETITLAGSYNVGSFTVASSDNGETAQVPLACFTAGTRITTLGGSVLVQDLRIGDQVTTVDGDHPTISWIGRRHVDCRRHPKPEAVWPVRIAAGAFNHNQPCRDIWLSGDHAVFVDGVLIPIKHLINGSTVAQMPVDEITYYHLELPQHRVILAEGLPCESYFDDGNRDSFANGGAVMRLFPDFDAQLPDFAALWEADACAPLVVAGSKLEAVRTRLGERAGLLTMQWATLETGSQAA